MSSAPAGKKAWNIPRRNDPRWVFAGLLACYAIAGCTVLGFNRAPLQILLTVAACAGLDMLFARVLRREKLFPLSAFITGLGLSLLVNYPHDLLLLFLPVFFAIASKYVLTCGGRHAFNPGLIGVLAAINFGGGRFATSPPYQWGEHPQLAAGFLALAAVAGFATRIRRGPLIASFLVSFAALTCLRAWLMRWHLPPLTLLEGTLTSPAFFLFAFYMITDPMTSPQGRGAQIAWGFAVAALDMVLHFRSSLATLFQALFLVSAARWVWWHGMSLRHTGIKSLLPPPRWLRSTAVLTATAVTGSLLYSKVLHPAVLAPRPHFVFEPVPAFPAEMSDLLTKVDPRIAHIAKWPLSVGDAVAVGDCDGDGRQDVFLTYPLKRAQDRNALYRNLGGMNFAWSLPPDSPLACFSGDFSCSSGDAAGRSSEAGNRIPSCGAACSTLPKPCPYDQENHCHLCLDSGALRRNRGVPRLGNGSRFRHQYDGGAATGRACRGLDRHVMGIWADGGCVCRFHSWNSRTFAGDTPRAFINEW